MKTILVTGGAGFIGSNFVRHLDLVPWELRFQGRGLPIADNTGDASLSLPFYANMPLEHVDVVARALAQALERGGRP